MNIKNIILLKNNKRVSEIKKISLNSFIDFDIENRCFVQGEVFFKQNKSILLEKLCEHYKEVIDILNEEIKDKKLNISCIMYNDLIYYIFKINMSDYIKARVSKELKDKNNYSLIDIKSDKLYTVVKYDKDLIKVFYDEKINQFIFFMYMEELSYYDNSINLILVKNDDFKKFFLSKHQYLEVIKNNKKRKK